MPGSGGESGGRQEENPWRMPSMSPPRLFSLLASSHDCSYRCSWSMLTCCLSPCWLLQTALIYPHTCARHSGNGCVDRVGGRGVLWPTPKSSAKGTRCVAKNNKLVSTWCSAEVIRAEGVGARSLTAVPAAHPLPHLTQGCTETVVWGTEPCSK